MKSKIYLSLLTLVGLTVRMPNAIGQTVQPGTRSPVADSTFGTSNTVVTGTTNSTISGGLNIGRTLFHSFTDFSVPTNGSANFSINPANTRDIISRVTGTSFSDINGTINSNGTNFFLINPNGIVFGPNASLNVGKAFMASTANGINLVDAGGRAITFGTNPGSNEPLLSVAPNVMFNVSSLNMGGGSGQITNFAALENINPNPSQYIGLIGGNVRFNGGQIFAPGAKVELGGLSQAGSVGFSVDNGVQLPANVARANISLVTAGTSPSIIDVDSGGGGSVGIFAKDITLQGTGTYISSGIATGLGSPNAKAGDIKLDATGDVRLSENDIFNQVGTGGVGKGGNIEINTRNLSVTDSARLTTSIFGQGDAGSVKITATENISFNSSYIISDIVQGAVGKGGEIEINTRNLAVMNGAQLTTSTMERK